MSEEKEKKSLPEFNRVSPAFLRRMIAYFDGVDEAEIELIGNAGMAWPWHSLQAPYSKV